MPHEPVSIRTRDGDCPVDIFTPSQGAGPWPGVIFFMDGLGARPAVRALAQQLADTGYVVLLPDIYYRYGRYAPLDPAAVFASGNLLAIIAPMRATTNERKAAQDAEALIACLDARDDVAGRKIGVVGFCMGGAMALTTAAMYPDRIAAAASFHGGNLVTDAPTSAHLVAPQIRGEVYIAAADNDSSYPPEMAERLEAVLRDAGVAYSAETYAGAAHGWMKPDFPVYDAAAAERGWTQLSALFDRTLR